MGPVGFVSMRKLSLGNSYQGLSHVLHQHFCNWKPGLPNKLNHAKFFHITFTPRTRKRHYPLVQLYGTPIPCSTSVRYSLQQI